MRRRREREREKPIFFWHISGEIFWLVRYIRREREYEEREKG